MPTTPDLGFFDRYRELIDDWPAFLAALRRPLPTTLWANTLRCPPEPLAEFLRAEGADPEPIPWWPGGFRLPSWMRPGKSLGFLSGAFHLQEEVSMLPVALLDPQPGERFLDLCAAPGNKTLQAAVRMENRGTVMANDKSKGRLGVVRRHVERLGLTNVVMTTADAGNLPKACGPFQRVLADVPCSCEGTSRKNPEVTRLKPTPGARAGAQLAILRKAVSKCLPGGRIVYSTCTYAPEENEAVVDSLLREVEPGSLEVLPTHVEGFPAAPGVTEWQGRSYHPSLANALRAYPHLGDTGGFFCALLEKRA